MTFKEFCDINAKYRKAFEKHLNGAPLFCFELRDVDLKEGLCLVNGEYTPIKKVITSITQKHEICITNPYVLSQYSGFAVDTSFYDISVLNKNRTLYASADFFTSYAENKIVKDFCENNDMDVSSISDATKSDIIDDYTGMCYDDLRMNLTLNSNVDVLVIMKIKRWNGVHYGYKVISAGSGIFGAYGCDSFAYYMDRYNVRFIGYHHDSDTIPNEGLLRVIKKDVSLSDKVLNNMLDKINTGEDYSALLSRYTESLNKYLLY